MMVQVCIRLSFQNNGHSQIEFTMVNQLEGQVKILTALHSRLWLILCDEVHKGSMASACSSGLIDVNITGEQLNKLLQFVELSKPLKPLTTTDKPEDKRQSHNTNSILTNLTNPKDGLAKPKKIYVDKWPEPVVRTDFTIVPQAPRSGVAKPFTGGAPVTPEIATNLRKVVHGSTIHSFTTEWKRACFKFRNVDSPFPYGLEGQRNGSRGIITCVQAFVIKQLVFSHLSVVRIRSAISTMKNYLKPTNSERKDALIKAMVEILWNVGENKHATIVLPQERQCFEKQSGYRHDGVTECLHLFEFKHQDDLKNFLTKYIAYFELEDFHGCVLFLYSLALTRTFEKLEEDFNHSPLVKLLNDMEDCSQSLVNLIITGKAVPYLHNGTMIYDSQVRVLKKPLVGILNRSDVGYLLWDKTELDEMRTQVGSMLKTPKLPIWITNVNGHFGLLFSTNPDLISDWRVEHRFTLHYYTVLYSQTEACQLSVDTRYGRQRHGKTALHSMEERKKLPALEQCIMTKWPDAQVTWNDRVSPFL
ncbi:inactive ubiquitin carboxyl-terminal hydrolase MINDY-4B-like isoform X2 [Lineus longissimus]|uniref:inactive ubiquitin carboxyl-terminal hydrolase MINDY-4B-like isoform X2 n=1 Tax=Lineus longissimus TaxID=88925 RepID=UPI002B4EC4CE